MADETANRSTGAPDGKGSASGGDGFGSPLQARAAFLKNWDWLAVISINQGACARGRAQHGLNSETSAACAADWEKLRSETLTLGETFDRLRTYHRRAPFLFFNGNTFSTIVGHYIAGVLDRESMVRILESLCETVNFKPGDRVKTMRGSVGG